MASSVEFKKSQYSFIGIRGASELRNLLTFNNYYKSAGFRLAMEPIYVESER